MVNISIFKALTKMRKLLSSREKSWLIKVMCFTLLMSVLEMMTATLFAVFSQVLVMPEAGHKYLSKLGMQGSYSESEIILGFAVAVGIIYLVKNSLGVVETFFQNFTVQKINYQFKKRFLKRFTNIDYNFYLTRNSIEGHAFISRDADTSFSIGLGAISSLVSESLIALSLVAFIIYLNPTLAIIIFGIGAITAFILTKWLLPSFYNWGLKIQETALLADKNLLQFFQAFKEIIVLGKRQYFINSYHRFSKQKANIQAVHNATNVLPRIVSELVFVFLFVVTIIFFTVQGGTSSQMVSILGGYLYVSFRLMPGVNRIITQLNLFKSVIPCIQRTYNEFYHSATYRDYIDCKAFEFNQGLVLKDVGFRYYGVDRKAISGVNLNIKKGECLGIIGKTGSGKSTLVDVILGLLQVDEGSILVDNQYPVYSSQWHRRIGYVQQTIYLLDDTITANIAFGEKSEDIDDARLQAAIDDAQLRDFIDTQPNGLETIVGERGIQLSGGERQRIAIARALYQQPDVLILDEATSALDHQTEHQIMQTVAKIQQTHKTMIIVAHRLSTLKHCDRIIEMKSGTIEKILSFTELMQSYELNPAEIASAS